MYIIPPLLLADRKCLDNPRVALYVEYAYSYRFCLSNRLPVLAGDGEYLAATDDDSF